MAQDARYSAKDVKVGILVTVSVILLLVLVAVTSDVGKYFRHKKMISVAFKHVVGLQANSPVNYSGVEVGRVKSVSVLTVDDAFLKKLVPVQMDMLYELPIEDPSTMDKLRVIRDRTLFDAEARKLIKGRDIVVLEMEVDAHIMDTVRVDDYVMVESTMMGDTSVQISPGAAEVAKPDAILLGRSGSMFTRISESVEEIRYLLRSAGTALSAGGADFGGIFRKVDTAANNLVSATDDFKEISVSVNEVLTASKSDVIKLTKTSREVSEQLSRILGRVEKDVDPITENVSVSTAKIRKMLEVVSPHVDPLVAGARRLSDKMESLSDNADKLVSTTNEMVAEGRADIRRTTLNVKDATKNMSELTALLSRKPWLLLRAPRGADRGEQDLVSLARLMLDAAGRAQDAATKLEARQAANPEEADRLSRTAADLKETSDNLRRAAEAMADVLRPLDRKNAGDGFEKDRRPAAEYPLLEQ
ncbi:MAG: MCE family protein [Planctomycetes bacterium]|nr:MCE family protein [Planctomycetota bacterium]